MPLSAEWRGLRLADPIERHPSRYGPSVQTRRATKVRATCSVQETREARDLKRIVGGCNLSLTVA